MSDFVICINNESNPASLIVGKVYRTLSDAEAEAHAMVRVLTRISLNPTVIYILSLCSPLSRLPEAARRALTAGGPERQRDAS